MSTRRSISFDSDEDELLKEFDTNGKSKFAKEAIKFFIKFRDKVFIMHDTNSIPQIRKSIDNDTKLKVSKLIKK